MTPKTLLASVLLAALLSGLLACTNSNNLLPEEQFSCLNNPVLRPDLPFDVDLPNHQNVQCFAWQEFIALNWPARAGQAGVPDTSRAARTWGDPHISTPNVWETYKEVHQVFLPNAQPPSAWGISALMRSLAPTVQADVMRSQALPEAPRLQLEDATQASGLQLLRMTSKVSERLQVSLQDSLQRAHLGTTDQAFGSGWLTGQNGRLTYYGIHMNRAEFDYIVANRFYDARQQRGAVINLPAGRTGAGMGSAQEGAIEVKSAWLDLTGMSAAQRRRFRTLRVCLLEGAGCRWATVGLVGLHIVHKTETFPQWTWATFEHVDSAPDREEVRQGTLRSSYTYHDPACPAGLPRCVPNTMPTSGDRTIPTQLVRQTPISADAQALNEIMQRRIRRANRDSVWQYYQLVEVQWPEAGETHPGTGNTPLPVGGPRPTSIANATLETYVQHQTCLSCHRGASVAPVPGLPGSSQATDYSFLFMMAEASP